MMPGPAGGLFENDTRQRVGNPQQPPWNNIGLLEASFGQKEGKFTGSLIRSPDNRPRVLTCAHCVKANGMVATLITFKPGWNNGVANFQQYSAASVSSLANVDLAVLMLNQIPNGLDGLNLTVATPSLLQGPLGEITLAGYPNDKGDPRNMYSQTGPFVKSNNLINDDELFYRLSTTSGNSGSPIFLGNPLLTQSQVIAVHTGEGEVDGQPYNFALKLDQPLIDWIYSR